MMVRADHNGQEPAEPMVIALGYQVKSVERHRFHMTVISVLRDCAVLASLKTRSLLRFNHHQESSLVSSSPPVGPATHVDVFEVGCIAASIRITAAHFRSCDKAGCPCWARVFPSKPEGELPPVQRWPEQDFYCAIRKRRARESRAGRCNRTTAKPGAWLKPHRT